MTDIADRVLRGSTGLTRNFSRMVLTLGHGSNSLNNPHVSQHMIAAPAAGPRGGANGRAICLQILNDPRVRHNAAPSAVCRFLTRPSSSAGMHNTSSETVTFFDLDLIPPTHRKEFAGRFTPSSSEPATEMPTNAADASSPPPSRSRSPVRGSMSKVAPKTWLQVRPGVGAMPPNAIRHLRPPRFHSRPLPSTAAAF